MQGSLQRACNSCVANVAQSPEWLRNILLLRHELRTLSVAADVASPPQEQLPHSSFEEAFAVALQPTKLGEAIDECHSAVAILKLRDAQKRFMQEQHHWDEALSTTQPIPAPATLACAVVAPAAEATPVARELSADVAVPAAMGTSSDLDVSARVEDIAAQAVLKLRDAQARFMQEQHHRDELVPTTQPTPVPKTLACAAVTAAAEATPDKRSVGASLEAHQPTWHGLNGTSCDLDVTGRVEDVTAQAFQKLRDAQHRFIQEQHYLEHHTDEILSQAIQKLRDAQDLDTTGAEAAQGPQSGTRPGRAVGHEAMSSPHRRAGDRRKSSELGSVRALRSWDRSEQGIVSCLAGCLPCA